MAIYERPKFLFAGDRAVAVELADEISPEINARIRRLDAALERQGLPGIIDLVPSYRSLLVYYDPLRLKLATLREYVLTLADSGTVSLPTPKVLQIPTCYGGEYGPDMPFVAAHTRLDPDEVATIHAGTDYLVYMMGFNTGFPYLGGMSARIAAPRLQTPRTSVPAGSIGIAQRQTGIYPVESPGGWRLIGRSPVRLFDPSREPPVSVEAGDYLRFVSIDGQQYREIEHEVESGRYQLRMTDKSD